MKILCRCARSCNLSTIIWDIEVARIRNDNLDIVNRLTTRALGSVFAEHAATIRGENALKHGLATENLGGGKIELVTTSHKLLRIGD